MSSEEAKGRSVFGALGIQKELLERRLLTGGTASSVLLLLVRGQGSGYIRIEIGTKPLR
jgi:hypothetical protein